MQNDEQEYLNAFRGKKDAEPTQDAAEGENDTPAVAVVIDAEQAVDDAAVEAGLPEGEVAEEAAAEGESVAQEAAEEGGEEVSPEDLQRQKSWEGRLRKREEELAAREAAAASMPAAEEVGDEEIAAIQASMSEDFGEEFVQNIMKLAGYAARKEAADSIGSHINPINETIAQAIMDVQEAFRSQHLSAIADAHEDFQDIVNSEPFSAFINELPEDQKAVATQVIESGTPKQVIGLLTQYKASLTPAQQEAPVDSSMEDALDAASGVRGSSPVQLPERAPVGGEDEYKAAWDSM